MYINMQQDSAATALSKQILEEGQPAVDRILRILKIRKLRLPNRSIEKSGSRYDKSGTSPRGIKSI